MMEPAKTVKEMFRDYPKEVILKDGTGVTLRPLEPGDEQSLHSLFRRFNEEDRWFLNHDVTDADLIHRWVHELNQERVVSIIARLEGRIIANAVLMMKDYGAKSHIGKVRITVDPDFRERRLGTWMLLDLISLGMAVGLRMLVMRLVQDRDASLINSVRKLDFKEEAVLRDYVLDRGGGPHHLVIMTKRLPLAWDET
jgi:hypothetical protein